MIQLRIPAPQLPPLADFTLGVLLDGVTYTLRCKWNESEARWYARSLDEPGAVILMGDCKLSVGGILFAAAAERLPPGAISVVDTSGQDLEAGLSDLGARVQLYYLSAAEVAALVGG